MERSGGSIHVLHTPMRLVSEKLLGYRWCFVCRKRRMFGLLVHTPEDEMSYYGPSASVRCELGHLDGDLFPGRYREWE